MKTRLFMTIMVIASYAKAQNLIQNPDFEQGPPITYEAQVHYATGWWGVAGYYGSTLSGSGSTDLFEVGANCAYTGTPSLSSKNLDVPNNKWTDNLPDAIPGNTRYAGGAGAALLNGAIDASQHIECVIGTITEPLVACNIYQLSFMHAPHDGKIHPCGLTPYNSPPNPSLSTQEMWIKLRQSSNHNLELLIAKVPLNPTIQQWDTYTINFALNQAEASTNWDRIEFVVVNPGHVNHKIFFLDNVSLELEEESACFESLDFSTCPGQCKWYMPENIGHDYYHLQGIQGVDPNDYNYWSNQINPGGYTGWIMHCLLPGQYQVDLYEEDPNGGAGRIIKTIIITVIAYPVECPEEETYSICGSGCATIGNSSTQSGSYTWVDDGTITTATRTVCPTQTTTYEQVFTNEYGCRCTTEYTVVVFPVIPPDPVLKDDTICLGEEFCFQYLLMPSMDFVTQCSTITFDMGDGTMRLFNPFVSQTFPSLHQCVTYDAPGTYNVSVTFHHPCGTYTSNATVLVKSPAIDSCSLLIPQTKFDTLPPQIDLTTYPITLEGGCCPELVANGTWFDENGIAIPNPTNFDKNILLTQTISKQYFDVENCTICLVTLELVLQEGAVQSLLRQYQSQFKMINGHESENISGSGTTPDPKEAQSAAFHITPNPNNGKFKIVNDQKIEVYDAVSIVDPIGRTIYTVNDLNADDYIEITTVPGVYVTDIVVNNHHYRLKFIMD